MHTHRAWGERLNALATAGGVGNAALDPDTTLVDNGGGRLAIDAYLLARIRGDPPPVEELEQTSRTVALRIWRLVCDGDAECVTLGGTPPLVAVGEFGSIETWSETLLCAAHGLGWLSRQDRARWSADRLARELDWLIEHVEPDNATRYPWAVHLFLDAALSRKNGDAMLYAQELLHACQVDRRRPTLRSAWILRDSAEWLRERSAKES